MTTFPHFRVPLNEHATGYEFPSKKSFIDVHLLGAGIDWVLIEGLIHHSVI